MTQFLILRDLGYVVLGAAIVLVLTRPLRMPPILAYIVAGLALGPLLHVLGASESLDRLSEIGVALLLFLVGLELSFEKVRGVGRVALVAGAAQVIITAAVGYAAARLLGFAPGASALLALAVTFSSTIVVVKQLDQRGDLDAVYGRIAVGVLLVQDVIVLIALTVLAALGAADAGAASDGVIESRLRDGGGLAGGVVRTVGGMAALGVVAFIAARYVARPFGWLARSFEALFIWSLCWCFLFILAAEALGLSVEIGAFIAGVSLAQLPYDRELRRRVQPLVSLFIAVFFVTLAARMELGAAAEHWLAALVLSLIVLLVKPVALMAIVPRLGYDERTSFLASVTLGQVSEFSFVLAGLGLAAGLLDEAALSLVGVIGVMTIGISSYVIMHGDVLYRRLVSTDALRLFHAVRSKAPSLERPPAGHVIVVGMNALGRRIVRALLERGEPVVVIDTDPGKLEGMDVTVVLGNASDDTVLGEANIAEAKLLISTLQIEDANNLIAYRCRRLGIAVSIHAFDPALIDDLEQIGVDHMMVSKHDGIRRVAAALRGAGVIP